MHTRWFDRQSERDTVPRPKWLTTIYLPLGACTGLLGSFSPKLWLPAMWTGFKYDTTASGSSTSSLSRLACESSTAETTHAPVAQTATPFLDDTTAVNWEFLWPLIIITGVSLGWVLSCPHTARP